MLHLAKALIQQPDGVVPQVFARLGADAEQTALEIESALVRRPAVTGGGEPAISRALRAVLVGAHDEIAAFGDRYVSTEHLLLAIARHGDDAVQELLTGHGVTRDRVLDALREVRGSQRVTTPDPESTYDALTQYGRDLTADARQGKLDPVIGRDDEIRRVIQILSRRTKNNPVLIGDPGVGKTAIAEGLAQRIVRGDVPESLRDRRLISLDLGAMVAGAKYR